MKDRSRVTSISSQSRRLVNGRPSPGAPAWPALIVILLAGIGLFALSDILTPESAWRPIADSLMVVLMFGAMAAWVRANRQALTRIDERAQEGTPLEIRYVASERPPLWRAETTRRRRDGDRLKGPRRS
jgi:hypothetical protein